MPNGHDSEDRGDPGEWRYLDSDAVRAKHERILASPTFRRLVDYWAGGWGDPPDLDAVSLLMDLAAANEDREAALARLVPELAKFWSPKGHVAGALRLGVTTEDIPDIEIKAKAVAVGLVEALSEASTEQTVRFGRKWLKNPDGSLRPVHPLEDLAWPFFLTLLRSSALRYAGAWLMEKYPSPGEMGGDGVTIESDSSLLDNLSESEANQVLQDPGEDPPESADDWLSDLMSILERVATSRELEIIDELLRTDNLKEVAQRLGIRRETVDTLWRRLKKKARSERQGPGSG